MTRIRVITDSACDLDPRLIERYEVTVVPLSIRFGSEEFEDGSGLSTVDFWARCATSPVLPETAAPAPGAFRQAFLQAAEDGCDGVLCVNLSSGLSATYQSAVTAARDIEDRVPVQAVDTRSVTMGEGLIVMELAERAQTGATLIELAKLADDLIPRVRVFGVLDTLDHLEKGGRIGGAQALLGSLLSIKPVVTVTEGVVEQESKQRTRSRSLAYLADKAKAAPPISRLAVCNGAADDIDLFLGMLEGVKTEYPIEVVDLGPVIGTHAGPGTIGLCFLTAT